jgi:putative tryptophan/tyrosine transport system substrate-binding protein
MPFDQLKRRKFITLLGGAAAWPLAAREQQTKVYRIGALLVGNAGAYSLRTELREELRRYGYVEGQNLIFEYQQGHGGPISR